jgi:hypothetical protein
MITSLSPARSPQTRKGTLGNSVIPLVTSRSLTRKNILRMGKLSVSTRTTVASPVIYFRLITIGDSGEENSDMTRIKRLENKVKNMELKPYHYATEIMHMSSNMEKEAEGLQKLRHHLPNAYKGGKQKYFNQEVTQEKVDELYLNSVETKLTALDCLTNSYLKGNV